MCINVLLCILYVNCLARSKVFVNKVPYCEGLNTSYYKENTDVPFTYKAIIISTSIFLCGGAVSEVQMCVIISCSHLNKLTMVI